jgi:hypothetical protein
MKVGRGIEALDLYQWLPGHGENAVAMRTEGVDLIVTVAYDGDSGVRERELRFTSVCSFYAQAFPGPSMLGLDDGEAALLLRGALVEYPDSEAAIVWSRHFRGSRRVRHYSVVFLAENRLLVVLSGGVSLGE